MSVFDPQAFLDMTVDGENSTKRLPVPEGEFIASIEKVDVRTWTSKNDPTKSGLTLDVIWNVDDADVKAALDMEKVTVKQGIMLDLTDAGGLDMGKGKNIGLGRLRAALNMNIPGVPFSFTQLPGQVARIRVTQRVEGEDIYNDVKGVAPLV